jgi:hypothetical protein
MEEIRPTQARRAVFGFLVLVFLFLLSLFPKLAVPSSPFFFFFFSSHRGRWERETDRRAGAIMR